MNLINIKIVGKCKSTIVAIINYTAIVIAIEDESYYIMSDTGIIMASSCYVIRGITTSYWVEKIIIRINKG